MGLFRRDRPDGMLPGVTPCRPALRAAMLPGAGRWHLGQLAGMPGAGRWHLGRPAGMPGAGRWHLG
ncbi:MAG TPA: hypothetical protein VIZ20_18265, partial [Streptosporangiaceae bacterium]